MEIDKSKLPIHTYYSQKDPEWSSQKIGRSTVARSGCGPMVLAMAIKHTDPTISVDPEKIVELIVKNNWFDYKIGTSWEAINQIPIHYKLKSEQISKNLRKIHSSINRGAIIVAAMGPGHFTRSGHIIIIVKTDLKQKELTIIDPNDGLEGKPKYLAKSSRPWSWEIIKAEALGFWAIMK